MTESSVGGQFWEPDPAALAFEEPAASYHAGWLVLVGDEHGLPSLGTVLHLLNAHLSAAGTLGRALFRDAHEWVVNCCLASVSDLRIRIQLARAVVAVHTRNARDDPNFTVLPSRPQPTRCANAHARTTSTPSSGAPTST